MDWKTQHCKGINFQILSKYHQIFTDIFKLIQNYIERVKDPRIAQWYKNNKIEEQFCLMLKDII